MKLVPTNEGKIIIKKYEEMCSKIKDIIRSITNNSDNYDDKCMNMIFNSYDYLPLNETLELHNMIIVVRAFFHEGSKSHPQFFLGKVCINHNARIW